MATNIDSAIQLNKLLKEQNQLILTQAKVGKGQLETMKAMVQIMAKLSADPALESFQKMDEAIKSADEALEEFGKNGQARLEEMNESVKKGSDGIKDFGDQALIFSKKSTLIAAFLVPFNAINSATRLGIGVFSSLISVVATLGETFLSLGVSIIAVPFKMLNALMQQAQSFTGTALWQAIEDTRKAFGNLAKNEGQAIIKGFRNIQGELANTGLSTRRVLGNMAERLTFVRETAEALGRTFSALKLDIRDNIEVAAAYVKGLGLANEGTKALGKISIALGQKFTETGRQITTMAYGMGETFGISGKLISRDVSEMVGDFENFGSVGIKTMTQVSVFTRKLGIELKDLLGVVGKFDDFETAAQSAAQLSQAFGIQVDALEMMKEQDPAARFENLRKAFLATGRSVEGLSRQERSLLAQQTGLTADAISLGFAQSNVGMSYDEIQKKAGLTEKKQLSQAEAMEKLSKSIERLVKQGPQLTGGFFDIFVQGFVRGVKWTREFWGLMMALSRAMRITYWEGIRVGQMFVKNFPGVSDVFEGLRELFQPQAWRTMMRGIGRIFEDFFKSLKSGGEFSFTKMLEAFRQNFFNWFDSRSPAGKKVLDGFRNFFLAMRRIGVEALRFVVENLTSGVKIVTGLIRDMLDPKKSFGSSMSGTGSKLVRFIKDEVFGPFIPVIKEQWPALKSAFGDLFELLKNFFVTTIWPKAKAMIWDIFIKAIEWTVLGQVISFTAMTVFKKIAGSIVEAGIPLLGNAFKKLGSGIPKAAVEGSEATKKAIEGATGLGSSFTKFANVPWSSIGKAVGRGVVGLVVLAGVTVVMAGNFLLLRKILSGVKIEDAKMIAMSLSAMTAAYIEAAGVAVLAAGLGILTNPTTIGLVGIGLAALATIVTGLATHSIVIIQQIQAAGFSSDVKDKVDIFINVARVMIDFAKSIGNIISLATPSFKTFFTGNPDKEFRKNLGKIKDIIQAIAWQVKDIITIVVSDVMLLSPQDLEAAKVLGPLLSTIGELATAMTPPPELTGNWFDKLIGVDTLGAVSSYMLRTADVMKTLIANVKPIFDSLAGESALFLNSERIASFSGFMQGVAGLLKSLTPTSDILNAFQPAKETPSVFGLFKGEVETSPDQGIKSVTDFMGKMIDAMTGPDGALNKIKDFTSGLIGSIGKLGTPEQIKAAQDVFQGSLASVVTITDMFSPDKVKNLEATSAKNIQPILQGLVTNVFDPLKGNLPALLTGFDGVAQDTKLLNKVYKGKISSGLSDLILEINLISMQIEKLGPIDIKTQLKQTSDKLGLKGDSELKIDRNDLKILVNVNVTMDADDLEMALHTRPRGSNFAWTGRKG
jgi:hypothetical protein